MRLHGEEGTLPLIMHQPVVNLMSLNNAQIQQPKIWRFNTVGCNAVLSGINLALRKNAPPPLSRQNMHYIQSVCHLFTTLHESGPKDLRSHSRVNVKSYKIMHRPLKRNHASVVLRLSPCLECSLCSFGNFPGV